MGVILKLIIYSGENLYEFCRNNKDYLVWLHGYNEFIVYELSTNLLDYSANLFVMKSDCDHVMGEISSY